MLWILASYGGCPRRRDVILLAHLRLFLFALPNCGQERLLVVPSVHVLAVVLHFNSWYIFQLITHLNISFQEGDVILNATIVHSKRRAAVAILVMDLSYWTGMDCFNFGCLWVCMALLDSQLILLFLWAYLWWVRLGLGWWGATDLLCLCFVLDFSYDLLLCLGLLRFFPE